MHVVVTICLNRANANGNGRADGPGPSFPSTANSAAAFSPSLLLLALLARSGRHVSSAPARARATRRDTDCLRMRGEETRRGFSRGEFLGRAARRGAVGPAAPARLSRVPPLARGVASPTSNLIRATTKITGEDSHMATTSTIARAGGVTVGKGDGRRRARGGQAPMVPRARELGSPTTARRGMAVGALAGGGAVGRVRAGAGRGGG